MQYETLKKIVDDSQDGDEPDGGHQKVSHYGDYIAKEPITEFQGHASSVRAESRKVGSRCCAHSRCYAPILQGYKPQKATTFTTAALKIAQMESNRWNRVDNLTVTVEEATQAFISVSFD